MRYVVTTTLAALVVMLAGPSFRPAQAASASSGQAQPVRVAQNQATLDIFTVLQDIHRLQDQVRDLRGRLDTLKYQLKQNEQGQRDLYRNLDNRISKLEAAVKKVARSRNAAPRRPSQAQAQAQAQAQDQATAATADNQDGESESQLESSYRQAFNKLKDGDYGAAIKGFNAFLEDHPESDYSDNAWYWLGEANYVEQNYDASLKAFRAVVNRFGSSNKVPGALYKIGVIQADRGETDNATATFNRVIDQYANDDAADLARERLKAMQG